MIWYWLRTLKCEVVGHADDFLVLEKPFCLRCHRFTYGLPPPVALGPEHLACWLALGLSEANFFTLPGAAHLPRPGSSSSNDALSGGSC